MQYTTNQAVLEALKIPHPIQFAPQAHLNREIETLRNENNTGTYIILGLGLLLAGVSFYLVMEKNRQLKITKQIGKKIIE